jgi:hypothetical protein
VKRLGKTATASKCCHPDLPAPVDLYPSLENPAFACPAGRFQSE